MAVDYTLDASGRVWLHEFNVAAAIDSGGPNFKPPWKQEVQWRMARDAVDLAMKTFHEQRQGRSGTISLAAQLKESIANTNWEVAYAEYDDGTVEYDAVLELTENEKLLLDGSAYADFNSLVMRKHDPEDVLESYVPQGIASTPRGWYVSMYASDGGALFWWTRQTGATIGRRERSTLGNACWRAFLYGGFVWVCNEGGHSDSLVGELVAFPEPRGMASGSTLVASARRVVDSRASYASLSLDGKLVCVGEFAYRGRDDYPIAKHHIFGEVGNKAWVACYDSAQLLQDNECAAGMRAVVGTLVPIPLHSYLVEDGCRASCFQMVTLLSYHDHSDRVIVQSSTRHAP